MHVLIKICYGYHFIWLPFVLFLTEYIQTLIGYPASSIYIQQTQNIKRERTLTVVKTVKSV